MQVELTVNETIAQGKSPEQIAREALEGLLIRNYVAGDLSLGEIKEALEFQTIEEVKDWFNERGIATIRDLPSDLENFATANLKELASEHGVAIPNL